MFSPTSPRSNSRSSTSTSAKIIPEKSKSLSISLFSRKASKSQVMAEKLDKLQCEVDSLRIVVSALNRNIAEFKAELGHQKSYAESLASSIDQEGTGVRLAPSPPPPPPPQYHRYDSDRRDQERRDRHRIDKEENCCYFL